MNIHPYAQLFPAIDGDDFQQLVEDIRENGLYEPITLLDGAILDGRNRYRACEAAGVTPRYETFQGDSTAALHYVLSKNIHRRHLTSSQRAVLALEIEPLFAEAAKKRQQLNAVRLNTELGRETNVAILRHSIDEGRAAEQAAAAVGTNARYVQYAKQIANTAPELIEPVRSGAMPLMQAVEVAKRQNGNGTPAALLMSDNNEWYTPALYVDAARQVMGAIDLDPASNEYANKTVRAERIYTIDDDGYHREWHGRVWLNPPYGYRDGNESNQALWSAKLINEYRAGRVSEACLLVNAVPGNKWFASLWDFPVCFPDHRIRFYNALITAGQPTHSNAIVYLGSSVQQFVNVFSAFGVVVGKLEPNV